ncbi:MAG: DUF2157 domain-containing protein [Steroidobacteraceae bacterium]|jgi:uncharacterized membrane protein|nr:DUF2157 domain-containing protein [Steroidobacteraceae bacterium]
MSRLNQAVEKAIGRWVEAGLLDAATADRLRAHEQQQVPEHTGRAAKLAFGLGGLLLAAGVFLFVAANWDLLSPWSRFGILAGIVAVLHLGGAVGGRFSPALATSLHAAGTAALGAGIFLAGQIFHLQEHWPEALLLWALGAGFAALLLRDWPQVLWVAVLGPAWLAAEWGSLFPWYRLVTPGVAETVLSFGLVVLSATYVSATGPGLDAAWRRALARLGAVGLVVAALSLASSRDAMIRELVGGERPDEVPVALLALGWGVALGLPLVLAWLLRRREAWPVAVAAILAGIVVALDASVQAQRLLIYLLYAAGSVGLVAWGFRDRERGRINLGVAGFTLTVFAFYFSSLFDMLGRAAGLIGMGVLFIAGGWFAERIRRRLIARFEGASP